MELRVGVGFERIGSEADAARRRGVEAVGFIGFPSGVSDASVAKPRCLIAVRDVVIPRHGIGAVTGRAKRTLARTTFICCLYIQCLRYNELDTATDLLL
jgi:hypothetical protein